METSEARFGALNPDRFPDPLAFLQAEHARQRALLGHLDRLARNPGGPAHGAMARALAAWIACELPLHLRDETDSLAPRLPDSARPLLDAVATQRAVMEPLRLSLRADLAHIAAGHAPSPGFRDAALRFAADYRGLLAIEDDELLPTARRGLAGSTLATIVREMAARRG